MKNESTDITEIIASLSTLPADQWRTELERRNVAPDLQPEVLKTLKANFLLTSSEKLPSNLGPYRLLDKIGEGGMGEVWRAEQRIPIRRIVAVKIMKRGLETKAIVARFEAERQALALMEHPAIAKVFDAGVTNVGRPYFVMEYVPGEPITTFCDRNRLSMDERLRLFQRVCEGVQHAHHKAVIHRDLKPGNVLVFSQDGTLAVKIIDFGVAKAVSHRLTERTLFTELGVIVGTPEYMSPEQAEMTQVGVDTRTDVYSLGVMLYELLTGVLPFEPADLRAAGFDELRRQIREVSPPKPSFRISSLGDAANRLAGARQSDLRQLRRELQGDLDWIILRAIEKEPERRYMTPADLAGDIERHLTSMPVEAGPPSLGYKLSRLVRRRRGAVLTLASLAILTLVGMIALAISSHQTELARLTALEAREDAISERRTSELEFPGFSGVEFAWVGVQPRIPLGSPLRGGRGDDAGCKSHRCSQRRLLAPVLCSCRCAS